MTRLAAFLQARGERVVEVGRPKRRPRRTGAKSDALDAVRAAREALAQDHLLAPRRRGDREALRVLLATRHSACAAKVCATNQLKALIVGRPRSCGSSRSCDRVHVVRPLPSDRAGLRAIQRRLL